MGITCFFGHMGDKEVWNQGLIFGTCRRCAKPLIRAPWSGWYAVPKGYTIRWKKAGMHAASCNRLISVAKQQAPVFHRSFRFLRKNPNSLFY